MIWGGGEGVAWAGSAAEHLPATCRRTPRRTHGIAAAPAQQGEIPERGELRCLSCSDALGLGIGLQRAGRGCTLLSKPCIGQEPGLEPVCFAAPWIGQEPAAGVAKHALAWCGSWVWHEQAVAGPGHSWPPRGAQGMLRRFPL